MLVHRTCGNCCLYNLCKRGCTNPGIGCGTTLPVWNGANNTLSPDDSQFIETRLGVDTKKIVDGFASLVNRTLNSFVKRNVPLIRVVLLIKNFGASYKQITEKSFPLLNEREEEICKAENMVEVLVILSNYWSWYNYRLLQNLIIELGDQEDRKRWEEYLERLTSFLNTRLTPSVVKFNFGNECGKNQKPLLIKVDEHWNIPLWQINEFHYKIAEILEVPPSELYLSSVSRGCICLNFLIQESTIKYALPLCVSQEEALLAAGVFRLECGEYVWQVCSPFFM